jgi:hypothetical protein
MVQPIDLANVPVLVENLERQELEVKFCMRCGKVPSVIYLH